MPAGRQREGERLGFSNLLLGERQRRSESGRGEADRSVVSAWGESPQLDSRDETE